MNEMFETLDSALRAWGADQEYIVSNRVDIQKSIDEMTRRFGPPLDYYTIRSGGYIGIRFAPTGVWLRLYPTWLHCSERLGDDWLASDYLVGKARGTEPGTWWRKLFNWTDRSSGESYESSVRECPCNPGFKLGVAQDNCDRCGEPVPYPPPT